MSDTLKKLYNTAVQNICKDLFSAAFFYVMLGRINRDYEYYSGTAVEGSTRNRYGGKHSVPPVVITSQSTWTETTTNAGQNIWFPDPDVNMNSIKI
jgi:hypothetical protein